MDNDFFNLYVDTLIKSLHDATSKHVITETKQKYAEQQLAALQTNFDLLSEEVEVLKADKQEIREEADILRTELTAARNDALQLRKDLAAAKATLEVAESAEKKTK